jgi:hypothetical protein
MALTSYKVIFQLLNIISPYYALFIWNIMRSFGRFQTRKTYLLNALLPLFDFTCFAPAHYPCLAVR